MPPRARPRRGRRRPRRAIGPARDLHRAGPIGPRQDEGELVATVAEDEVGVAARGDDRGGDLVEEPVAGLVAEGVADGLEVVEADHDEAERAAVVDDPGEAVLERAVVEQPGQGVGPGPTAITRCVSAFWRAIETWAANSLTRSYSSSVKRSSGPRRSRVRNADRAVAAEERDADEAPSTAPRTRVSASSSTTSCGSLWATTQVANPPRRAATPRGIGRR